MYQSTAGTSLSRVAHAAAHNTPEGRCVSAGGSTVPACGQIHSSPDRTFKGKVSAGKLERLEKSEKKTDKGRN